MATLERQDLPQQATVAASEAEAGDERAPGAVFRAVNDRLIRLYRGADHEIGLIVCECARAGCSEPVAVSLEEYEAAHASPSCFLVAPGHEFARGQRPLLRTERFVLVEERAVLTAWQQRTEKQTTADRRDRLVSSARCSRSSEWIVPVPELRHEQRTEGATMQSAAQPSQPQPKTEPVEARSAQLRRRGRRAGLYTWAFLLVALLVVVVALTIANTRQVKLSWVVGTSHASLVWIILAAAVLGWLLGIVTSIVVRRRTRRRRSPALPRESQESPHISPAGFRSRAIVTRPLKSEGGRS